MSQGRSDGWDEDLCEGLALKIMKRQRRSQSVTWSWSCGRPETVSFSKTRCLERSKQKVSSFFLVKVFENCIF